MKTIMKLPLYIEVETGSNVDRSVVSKAASDILIPEIVKYLSQGKFKTQVLNEVSGRIGVPADVQILTQIDVLHNRVNPSIPNEV